MELCLSRWSKTLAYSFFIPVRKMSILLGVIQMTSSDNKQENFAMAKQHIVDASSKGAKIVFLPECFDFVSKSRSFTLENAEPISGPLIEEYSKLARDTRMWISLGGAHCKANDPSDARVYNTHILLNDHGQVVATYNKVHLFDVTIKTTEESEEGKGGSVLSMLESKVVRSGQSTPPVVHDTPLGSLGLSICYDMRFPELAAYQRHVGKAHVLTYPSAFTIPTGQAGHWHTLLRARAIENQCFVIAAAQEGIHNNKRSSYGRSLVIDPFGQILAERTDPGPGLLLCELKQHPSLAVRKVRQSVPVSDHRRFDLFLMQDSGCAIDIGPDDYTFGPHTIPSACVFYRSAMSFAFVNISPLVPGHVLVSPVTCLARFDDLTPTQVADLFLTVKQIAGRIASHFSATSLTISIQDGVDAGQSVPHVHIHVLPRKPNDFTKNDDIYTALQQHDKVADRIYRSVEEMTEEASILRGLFYPVD